MRQVKLTAKRTFVVCITEVASLYGTNLRMNHAQVYVNRMRPKYTYTPGAFTSSIREEVPTLSLHSTGSFHGYHIHVPARRTWIFRNIISFSEFGF